MVHDSEGSLGNLPSIYEFTEKVMDSKWTSSAKCINTRMVQALSTNSKAIPPQGQACNLASSHLDIGIEDA